VVAENTTVAGASGRSVDLKRSSTPQAFQPFTPDFAKPEVVLVVLIVLVWVYV
jgi:hypothetical protein